MPNPLKGEVALELADGRQLTLRLDYEGLIAAEQLYGKRLSALMADAALGFVGAIRALLYSAVRAHHPEIDAAEAAEIALRELDPVSEALGRAIEAAFPERDNEGAEGRQRENPRGKRSGRSGAKRGSSRSSSSG